MPLVVPAKKLSRAPTAGMLAALTVGDRTQHLFSYFDTPRTKGGVAFDGTDYPLLEKQLMMLERATGLSASFHDLSGVTYLVKELALPLRYRSHSTAHCESVKGSENFQRCVRCKYLTNFLLQKRRRSFAGVCHAGVWDFVYPVFFGDSFLGSLFLGSARVPHRAGVLSPDAYRQLPLAPATDVPLEELSRTVAEWIICCLRSHGISPKFFDSISRRKPGQPAKPLHWLVRSAMKLVEERFNETLSLSFIGQQLKVRPQYLCRLFSESQGMSLTGFIHRVRIRHAKELLLTGRYNVTEVATRVGFDDSSYFTRIFHRLEAKSPSEFLTGKV